MIEPERLDADQDVALVRHRIGQLLDPQDLGAAKLLDSNRFHDVEKMRIPVEIAAHPCDASAA